MKNIESGAAPLQNAEPKQHKIAKNFFEQGTDVSRRQFLSLTGGAIAGMVAYPLTELEMQHLMDGLEFDEAKLAELKKRFEDEDQKIAASAVQEVVRETKEYEGIKGDAAKVIKWFKGKKDYALDRVTDFADTVDKTSTIAYSPQDFFEYKKLDFIKVAYGPTYYVVFTLQALLITHFVSGIINNTLVYRSKQKKDKQIQGILNEQEARITELEKQRDQTQALLKELTSALKSDTPIETDRFVEIAENLQRGIVLATAGLARHELSTAEAVDDENKEAA